MHKYAHKSPVCLPPILHIYLFTPPPAPQLDYALSEQLREKYQLNVSFVSLVMIGFILLALVCATVMVAQQILLAARVPTIRLQRTGEPPELPFAKVTHVPNAADFNPIQP